MFDWRDDDDWPNDPHGVIRAVLLIVLATACIGIGMIILWMTTSRLP